MANDSVGQVSLDLILNSKEFENKLNNAVSKASNNINTKMNKSLGKSSQLLGKVGKLAVAAFSIRAITNFSKECVELGSNLAEVQNVVDSTFTTMSEKVNEFAETSITRLGMSETTYKKMVGTMGAMSKSFGFTEAEALKMADSITALTADVASFYNLSHDEAYTKMKSIYTGETESLKDLGVVMTQAALNEYALANGFGKTTDKMTEQEKVALRYSFVMKQLETANGDFMRTSDGWANQTRILTENFNKLKASIGQGLINVLLPVIRVINNLMAKLQVLGEMFSNFTAKIFGKADTSTSSISSSINDSLSGITDSSNSASEAVGGVADSAADAAKQINKTVFGFDELNTLQAPEDASGGGSGVGGIGGLDSGLNATTSQQEALNKETSIYEKVLDRIIKKAKELAKIFKKGLSLGLDASNFSEGLEGLKNSFKSIQDSFVSIFGDGKVLSSFSNLINSMVEYLGTGIGVIVGVGTSIANGLVGSIAKYLDDNKDFIKEKIINIFNISSEIFSTLSKIFKDVGEIISNFFNSDVFASFGSNIIGILVNPFLNAKELLLSVFRDLLNGISTIISENKTKIEETLMAVLSLLDQVSGSVKSFLDFVGQKALEIYNTYIGPAITSICNGISQIMDAVLTTWNNYVAPVLDQWGEKFSELVETKLKPLAEKIMTAFGKIAKIIGDLWENVLAPLISFLIEIFGPAVEFLVKLIGDVVFKLVEDIIKSIDDIVTVFNWLVDILKGIVDFVVYLFTDFGEDLNNILTNLGDSIMNGFTFIKDGAVNLFNGMIDTIKNIFGGLADVCKAPINTVIGYVNKAIDAINGLSVDIPDWVPIYGGDTFGFNIPNVPELAEGGYIKSPTLAMVGEGKENEIVAPESKMREIRDEGVNSTNTLLNQMIEQNRELINIMMMLLNKDSDIYMDSTKVGQMITNYQNSETRRRG